MLELQLGRSAKVDWIVMSEVLRDQAIDLMTRQRFGEALPLLRQCIQDDPAWGNSWYMAGQCCRFLGDIDGAIPYLERAAELNSDEPPVYLALGIAYQHKKQWTSAIAAFRRALEIDSEYEFACNSLALTQMKCGELEKALLNYDVCANLVARRIVKSMRNSHTSPIFKHRETVGTFWLGYVMKAMLFLASNVEHIAGIGWLSGEQAIEEEQTERHAGLYWTDTHNEKNQTERLFLPNYFSSFRELLRQDALYSNILLSRGMILELLGQVDEARQHFVEAAEFQA